MLWRLISRVHSLLSCRGTHELRTKTVFNIDPNGPEIFTGFPPGGPPAGLSPAGDRGRYQTFEYCRRCGLRPVDGKYEIW